MLKPCKHGVLSSNARSGPDAEHKPLILGWQPLAELPSHFVPKASCAFCAFALGRRKELRPDRVEPRSNRSAEIGKDFKIRCVRVGGSREGRAQGVSRSLRLVSAGATPTTEPA